MNSLCYAEGVDAGVVDAAGDAGAEDMSFNDTQPSDIGTLEAPKLALANIGNSFRNDRRIRGRVPRMSAKYAAE